MKLPIILSAMIAALAIPGTLASQDGAEQKGAESAPAAAPEAGAPDAAAPDAAAPAGEEKPAKKKRMKRKRAEATDNGAPRKHPKHRHHKGKYADGSGGHVPDKWDAPYDYIDKSDESSGCSGDNDDHGKQLPNEVPGERGPKVPRGM